MAPSPPYLQLSFKGIAVNILGLFQNVASKPKPINSTLTKLLALTPTP